MDSDHPERKPPRRVLVVDDEPGIGKVLRIKLQLSGFEVLVATGGARGVELARTRHPDVMLLDMIMPDMSGFDVLEAVRTFSQVPIIVFTARPELAESALRKGADDTITKPFIPDELVEKIEQVLASRGQRGDGSAG